MSRLINIGVSTMLSGGIIGSGSAENYVSDAARRALGMGLSQFADGQVQYCKQNHRPVSPTKRDNTTS